MGLAVEGMGNEFDPPHSLFWPGDVCRGSMAVGQNQLV